MERFEFSADRVSQMMCGCEGSAEAELIAVVGECVDEVWGLDER